MNVKQDTTDDASNQTVGVLQLSFQNGETGLLPEDPGKLTECLIEKIKLRATVVGPVLEAILHEQHGQSHWGLNE